MARQFDIDSKVHEWYGEVYPKDVLRKAINEDVTFRDVVECLNRNENPMFLIGLHDSFVRDRIFGKVAVLSGVSYAVVNNKWLLKDVAPDVPVLGKDFLEYKVTEAEKVKAEQGSCLEEAGRVSGVRWKW